jgi:hypothetical protein
MSHSSVLGYEGLPVNRPSTSKTIYFLIVLFSSDVSRLVEAARAAADWQDEQKMAHRAHADLLNGMSLILVEVSFHDQSAR